MEKKQALISDLGFGMARVTFNGSAFEPSLTIVTPSYETGDGEGFAPATSVEVYGRVGIGALRDLLNLAVPVEEG